MTPGRRPTGGTRFSVKTRAGSQAVGTLFRSSAGSAPLLVFVGEWSDAADAWEPTLRTLRASRDYHFVVVDAPAAAVEAGVRVEATRGVDVLEAALNWARQELRPTVNATVLLGGGRGAAAAVLLAGARRDVLAVVAVSAPPRLGAFRLLDVLPKLRGRHTRWVVATGDERGAATAKVAAALPLGVISVRPGTLRGAALLAADRRARTSLAGWLFSVTPVSE